MPKRAARMLRLMDRTVALWHIPVIGREKGRVIRRLLLKHQPRRALEVGTLLGYSAILIAGHLPRGGRLTCVEQNAYLAKFAERNLEEAGLQSRARVVVGDALRVLPFLRGLVDFMLIDAKKGEYLDYLKAVEPRLTPGAVVAADNTGIFRRDVRDYLAHVRRGPYDSREHDFGSDCMEVSIYLG
jgi:predicted O-methyltransferase YrrM